MRKMCVCLIVMLMAGKMQSDGQFEIFDVLFVGSGMLMLALALFPTKWLPGEIAD